MSIKKLMVMAVSVIMMAPVLVDAGGSVEKHIEAYVNYVNLVVDGEPMNVDTIIYESTTYVPIRSVAEYLGKSVGWDKDTKTASIEDYPFLLVDDQMIEGKWASIDYVDNFGDFEVGSRHHSGDLHLTGISFTTSSKVGFEIKGKQMDFDHEFVADVIIHEDASVNRYYVQLIEDDYYMFYEWDGSDGVHKDMTPDYYVLKKVKDKEIKTGLEDLEK